MNPSICFLTVLLAASFFNPLVAKSNEVSCKIPIDGKNFVSDEVRLACLRDARLIGEQPRLDRDSFLRGPQSPELKDDQWLGFDPSATIRCRYYQEDWGGNSPKFYCLRSQQDGELFSKDSIFSSDGSDLSINGAQLANQQNELLDSAGNAILDEKGKPIEADEIKVKYFRSKPVRVAGRVEPQVPDREREVFTEVATTRFFWAMGIPADRMYPVQSVLCDGCESDPFDKQRKIKKQNEGDPSELVSNLVSSAFNLVSIERKFDGKRIEPEAGRVNDGKKGFDFSELAKAGSRERQALEMQIFLLAASVVNYHNDSPIQNRLTCAARWFEESGVAVKGYDKKTGDCFAPVAMIQDVGSTFGSKKGFMQSENPRGDFAAYSKGKVFKDSRSCTLNINLGPHGKVGELARREFVRRLDAFEPLLADLVSLARFDYMDSKFREQNRLSLVKSLKREPTVSELNASVKSKWVQAISKRFSEIRSANCPIQGGV